MSKRAVLGDTERDRGEAAFPWRGRRGSGPSALGPPGPPSAERDAAALRPRARRAPSAFRARLAERGGLPADGGGVSAGFATGGAEEPAPRRRLLGRPPRPRRHLRSGPRRTPLRPREGPSALQVPALCSVLPPAGVHTGGHVSSPRPPASGFHRLPARSAPWSPGLAAARPGPRPRAHAGGRERAPAAPGPFVSGPWTRPSPSWNATRLAHPAWLQIPSRSENVSHPTCVGLAAPWDPVRWAPRSRAPRAHLRCRPHRPGCDGLSVGASPHPSRKGGHCVCPRARKWHLVPRKWYLFERVS